MSLEVVAMENENEQQIKLKPEQLGEGIKFERLRRITGYLVGDYETRFNNAKRAEVEDRVKHNTTE